MSSIDPAAAAHTSSRHTSPSMYVPVPGGPYSRRPRTCLTPSRRATSGGRSREARARRRSVLTWRSRPPMPSCVRGGSIVRQIAMGNAIQDRERGFDLLLTFSSRMDVVVAACADPSSSLSSSRSSIRDDDCCCEPWPPPPEWLGLLVGVADEGFLLPERLPLPMACRK